MSTTTLELVDEVINRTGATYKEAKEALEFCEGDIVDAIVYIETMRNQKGYKPGAGDKGAEILEKVKEFTDKGMVTRIFLEKNGRTVMDIPVIAGGLAALIYAGPTAVAIIAAIATGCELKIVKEDGEVINVNEMTEDAYEKAKSKFSEVKKSMKPEKSEEASEVEDLQEEDITEANFMETPPETQEKESDEPTREF